MTSLMQGGVILIILMHSSWNSYDLQICFSMIGITNYYIVDLVLLCALPWFISIQKDSHWHLRNTSTSLNISYKFLVENIILSSEQAGTSIQHLEMRAFLNQSINFNAPPNNTFISPFAWSTVCNGKAAVANDKNYYQTPQFYSALNNFFF